MGKDTILRVRIYKEQLEGMRDKVKEFNEKYPHKHISVGTIVRFAIHCFLKETCCVGRARLEGVMSYDGKDSDFLKLI